MPLKVERVDTWAATVEDRPGRLAAKLNAITGSGVNLEMVIARRTPERAGSGVVYVAPIQTAREVRVAKEVGFSKTQSLHTIRVEGPNKPGHGLNIVSALAAEGLNLRGFTAAAIGNRFVAYLGLDTAEDATKAVRVLRKL